MLFSFAVRATPARVKVCFAGSTVAGALLMTTRATFADKIRPETVTVFDSTVLSSTGDSKRIRLPLLLVLEGVVVIPGVVTVGR